MGDGTFDATSTFFYSTSTGSSALEIIDPINRGILIGGVPEFALSTDVGGSTFGGLLQIDGYDGVSPSIAGISLGTESGLIAINAGDKNGKIIFQIGDQYPGGNYFDTGKFGFATVTPAVALSVQGAFLASSNGTFGGTFTATGTVRLASVNGKVGAGATTTPFAQLSINASAGTTSFAIGSSTLTLFDIDPAGHLLLGGNNPVLSSCGTSPSVLRGNDVAASIKIGNGAVNACTVTFKTGFGTAPKCFVNINSPTATSTTLVASTTAALMLITATASNIGGSLIDYFCVGN